MSGETKQHNGQPKGGLTVELSGKVAMVTGGAMGIALASAECLIRQGAAVMRADCNRDTVSAAAQNLPGPARQVDCVVADISKVVDIENAVRTMVKAFGGINILVNNAGIQTFGDPVTTTEEVGIGL